MSLAQKKDEYFLKLKRQKSLGRLKEFKKFNIFIADYEVECLKELKRQKDEYIKRLKGQKS